MLEVKDSEKRGGGADIQHCPQKGHQSLLDDDFRDSYAMHLNRYSQKINYKCCVGQIKPSTEFIQDLQRIAKEVYFVQKTFMTPIQTPEQTHQASEARMSPP